MCGGPQAQLAGADGRRHPSRRGRHRDDDIEIPPKIQLPEYPFAPAYPEAEADHEQEPDEARCGPKVCQMERRVAWTGLIVRSAAPRVRRDPMNWQERRVASVIPVRKTVLITCRCLKSTLNRGMQYIHIEDDVLAEDMRP